MSAIAAAPSTHAGALHGEASSDVEAPIISCSLRRRLYFLFQAEHLLLTTLGTLFTRARSHTKISSSSRQGQVNVQARATKQIHPKNVYILLWGSSRTSKHSKTFLASRMNVASNERCRRALLQCWTPCHVFSRAGLLLHLRFRNVRR